MRANKTMVPYADDSGTVYEHPDPDLEPLFRTGNSTVSADPEACIPMPYGTLLYALPDRDPLARRRGGTVPVRDPEGGPSLAVASFLPSGYLRTYLPSFRRRKGAVTLPLWAYAGLILDEEDFLVPAMRIDDDPRSDPAIHENDDELERAIGAVKGRYGKNRLVGQLSRCAVEYRCLCARNFFLSRYEAPVPTTPGCNASCLGCLSEQEKGAGFQSSQNRLDFTPNPGEIAEVMVHHIERVTSSVVSFGQGCEGEPLLRGKDLAAAVSLARERTDRGTIHLNTNGSLPQMADLMIRAGLDSIRVSLNSPTREYYDRYYRQKYPFDDVLRTIDLSLEAGIFVSLNLLFMPGFTDMETEAESLYRFLDRFPVSMIQTRNLNIDPDLYFEALGFTESEPLGTAALINSLRERYPAVRLGYYNPPVRE